MEKQLAVRKTECHSYEDYREPSSLWIQNKRIILYKLNDAHLTTISSS